MATTTKTYETIDSLRQALPWLPTDAVIRGRDGYSVNRNIVPRIEGRFAPYTVTYEVPDTPAPLDPSKVKAGDTVTMRVTPVEKGQKPFMVEGEAYGSPGALMVGGLWVMNDEIATITDHQPAPEPKPDCRGQFVAARKIGGNEWHGFVDNDGDFSGMEDGFRRSAHVESLVDIRPLVVIDPAEVDVDAIATKAFTSVSVVERVFEAIGLEAS